MQDIPPSLIFFYYDSDSYTKMLENVPLFDKMSHTIPIYMKNLWGNYPMHEKRHQVYTKQYSLQMCLWIESCILRVRFHLYFQTGRHGDILLFPVLEYSWSLFKYLYSDVGADDP